MKYTLYFILYLYLNEVYLQKQSLRDVFRKRSSEHMQQIYSRTLL